MADNLIEFKNIKKRFGKKSVLDGVHLDIKQGEIFGIIGSSGSGKTTLLNTLIGFVEPDEGDIMFRFTHLLDSKQKQMFSVFKKSLEIKREFGFAAQEPSFYNLLTVAENLDFFGSLYSLGSDIKKTNIDTLISLMDLEASRNLKASELSGGMQKRLDISCSLIHDPTVLIMDEPTADLDPVLRKQMWDLIKKINGRGTTILLASHFLEEIETICDRIGILHNGRMIEVGTPDEIKSLYSRNEEIHLESSPGKYDEIIKHLEKIKVPKISKIVNRGNKMIIYTPKAEPVLHHLLHILERTRETPLDIDLNKPSLNEVFEVLESKNPGAKTPEAKAPDKKEESAKTQETKK